MNLYQFIDTIKQVALAHKDVNAFNNGDVYEIMNSGQHNYPAIVLTINTLGVSVDSDDYQTVNCVLFYIDRLTDDDTNKTMVQSQGLTVLKQIKTHLTEVLPWDIEVSSYTPYTEKFQDLCAGVYAECTVTLEEDIICSDTSYTAQQLNVNRNGLYSTIGYDTVLVEVPDPQLETLSVIANGVYAPEAPIDGYNKVLVNVPDPELEDITITANGNYRSEKYGFSDVIVNVPLKPVQEKQIEIQSNGTQSVTPDDGYDLSKVDITVNVPDPELEELTASANGEYTPDKYGYSKVTVDVPPTPVQEKQVSYDTNGTYEVTPSEGYNISKVNITVDVPDKPTQEKILNLTKNGRTIVTPDEGYTLRGVDVNVNVPPTPTQAKSVVYDKNGDYKVYPDEDSVLSRVDVTVDVPDPVIEDIDIVKNGRYIPDEGVDGFGIVNVAIPVEQKKTTVTENNTTTVITPTEGSLMDKVTVTTAIPQQQKTETVTENKTTVTIKPDEGQLLDNVQVTVDIPVESPVEHIIQNNQTLRISNNPGLLEEVTVITEIPEQEKTVDIVANGTTVIEPDDAISLIKKVTVNVNVPDPELEQKTATITHNNSSVTVTPSEGKLLDSVTVTANIPTEIKTATYTKNGTYTISHSVGALIDKAQITVNVEDTGGPFDFKKIGYTGDEEPIVSDIEYSYQVLQNWSPNDNLTNNTKLVYCPNIDLSERTLTGVIDPDAPVTMSAFFRNCFNLTTVPALNTSNIGKMQYMFQNCTQLRILNLFDTSKVINMCYMFSGCWKLETIPRFNTSKVTDMSGMFTDCRVLTELPLLDTVNVIDMSAMFNGCTALTSIPQFDTSNVVYVDSMFYGCSSLETLPLLDWGNVNLHSSPMNTFSGCKKLKNVGGFKDVGKAANSIELDFGDCPLLTAQSVQNIIDNLYNLSSGVTGEIEFNSAITLTDAQKQQIANKNWTLTTIN